MIGPGQLGQPDREGSRHVELTCSRRRRGARGGRVEPGRRTAPGAGAGAVPRPGRGRLAISCRGWAAAIVTDQRIVTVALVVILFDGGMHIGWRRFRPAAGAVPGSGWPARSSPRPGCAVLAHWLFGLGWRPRCSRHGAGPDRPGRGVLGARPARDRRPHRHPAGGRVRRQRPGRHRADGRPARRRPAAWPRRVRPASGSSPCRWRSARRRRRRGAGAAAGVMRRVPLPNEALYPLRTLAFALAALRRGHGRARLGLPGRVRRRHRRRRRAGAVQAGDRALPLGPGQPRRDRRVRRPRADRRPATARARRRVGRASGSRRCSSSSSGRCSSALVPAAGPAGRRRARVRAVGRAEGRGADPARHLRARRARRRRAADLRAIVVVVVLVSVVVQGGLVPLVGPAAARADAGRRARAVGAGHALPRRAATGCTATSSRRARRPTAARSSELRRGRELLGEHGQPRGPPGAGPRRHRAAAGDEVLALADDEDGAARVDDVFTNGPSTRA